MLIISFRITRGPDQRVLNRLLDQGERPSSVFAGRPLHEPSVFPIAVICVQSYPLRNSPSRYLSTPLNGEELCTVQGMPPFPSTTRRATPPAQTPFVALWLSPHSTTQPCRHGQPFIMRTPPFVSFEKAGERCRAQVKLWAGTFRKHHHKTPPEISLTSAGEDSKEKKLPRIRGKLRQA